MTRRICLMISLLVLVLATGCSAADGGADSGTQAPAAIQSYLEALVAKDANQMIALSCSEWEPQARLEFELICCGKGSAGGPSLPGCWSGRGNTACELHRGNHCQLRRRRSGD